jgi:hypothetical protein
MGIGAAARQHRDQCGKRVDGPVHGLTPAKQPCFD